MPAIADAFYEGTISKADLVKATASSAPADKVSTRISSDVCDGIPVNHQKAEASVAAFNAVWRGRPDPKPVPLDKERDVIASVLRPIATLKQDTVDLFGAGKERADLIKKLSGLADETIANAEQKGRLNAYTCDRLARAALAASLYFGLDVTIIEAFTEFHKLQALMEWQEFVDDIDLAEGQPATVDTSSPENGTDDVAGHDGVSIGRANMLLNKDARHAFLTHFIDYVATVEVTDSLELDPLIIRARQPLREFFTAEFTIFRQLLATGDDGGYLINEEDQVAASAAWRDWAR